MAWFGSVKRAVGHVVWPHPVRDVPPGQYLDLPGRGTTYVTDSGPREAPVVFLLHSVATTGLLCWYPAIPKLNTDYRVITIDHRWHGRGIRTEEEFTLEDCADDAAAAARQLGIDSFVAAGFSMGGGIAQLLWQRHPELVRGLVLCSTGPFFSSIDPGPLAADRKIGEWARRFSRITPTPSESRLNDPNRHPAIWAITQFLSTPLTEMAEFSTAMGKFDARPWLKDIDVPTAVVVSTKDKTVPPKRQHLLVNGISGAEAFDVDGGHACCVLEADRFVPQLRAGIDRVVAAPQTGAR